MHTQLQSKTFITTCRWITTTFLWLAFLYCLLGDINLFLVINKIRTFYLPDINALHQILLSVFLLCILSVFFPNIFIGRYSPFISKLYLILFFLSLLLGLLYTDI